MVRNNKQFGQYWTSVHKGTWDWAPGETLKKKDEENWQEYLRWKLCIYLSCGQWTSTLERNCRGIKIKFAWGALLNRCLCPSHHFFHVSSLYCQNIGLGNVTPIIREDTIPLFPSQVEITTIFNVYLIIKAICSPKWPIKSKTDKSKKKVIASSINFKKSPPFHAYYGALHVLHENKYSRVEFTTLSNLHFNFSALFLIHPEHAIVPTIPIAGYSG